MHQVESNLIIKFQYNSFTALHYTNTTDLFLSVVADDLPATSTFIKNHSLFRFKQLTEIVTMNKPEAIFPFTVTYIFYSLINSTRLYINVQTIKSITSLTSVFASADWLEREVWDMFGIFFTGHNNLRRILTDYGFNFHPLCKNFPLSGFYSLLYDDVKQRILKQNIVLSQELRVFHLKKIWGNVI